jgi:transposase
MWNARRTSLVARDYRRYGATAVIPSNRIRKVIIPHNAMAYRKRNRIERCFCRLKHFWRFATRYDRRCSHFAGFIHLAAAMI